jgi:MFS family permease
MQNKYWKDRLLYSVAILGSLSEAAAIMTLLALSSSFLAVSREGFASSSISIMYYLGIGCIGFLGGAILQKWSSISLGIIGPLFSATIVFFLAGFKVIDPFVGLPAVFLIFLLTGIGHPNNLRFFNQVLPEHRKLSFFSLKEGLTAIFTISAPIIASILITRYGTRICFIIDGCAYLMCCLPWIFLGKKALPICPENQPVKWLIGFQEVYRNIDIRSLTLGRLFNNVAFVFYTTATPLVIARIARGDMNFFASRQGIASSVLSVGFISASIIGTRIARKNKVIVPMIYLTPILAFLSVIFLITSIAVPSFLFLSAIILGVGTYCFRISGMTLGQSFTPPAILGPVIIAGDTVVRLWSFFISLLTLLIFECADSWNLSYPTFFGLSILAPSVCLFAPIWMRQLARQFAIKNDSIEKNQENSIEAKRLNEETIPDRES